MNGRFRSGQKWMANQALIEMQPYVPLRNNSLRDSGTVSSDGKSIQWHTPYARTQFYGIVNGHRIRNYTTPGTGKRWDLRTKGNSSKMNNITHAFIEGAKLNGFNR